MGNAGPSTAGGIVTSDPLPDGFTFASSEDDCAPSGTTVTCDVGTLDAGRTATATFVVDTPGAGSGTVVNTATVTSADSFDPSSGNNTATAISGSGTRADLSLTKSTEPSAPIAGGQVTYTLVARNAGPSHATDVTVSDDLPPGVSFVSGNSGGGTTCSASDGVVSCPLGTVDAGTQEAVTIIGAVGAGARGPSTNTASVASAEVDDPSPGDNAASSPTTPPRRARPPCPQI